MDSDDDDKDTVLEVIPVNQLRLIPLYGIITHIYKKIIEKAAECEVHYAFNIEQLMQNYGMNAKLATPANKTYIINEINRLFPGIKIAEIGEKYSAKSQYNSHWRACWEEDTDDVADSDCELLEEGNGENDDDIMLNQAIQLSLKEVKPQERVNTHIMGEKAEERMQKSRQKYKKLYK